MSIVMARSLLEELEAKLTDLDAVIKKADAEKRRKVSKLFFSAVSLNYWPFCSCLFFFNCLYNFFFGLIFRPSFSLFGPPFPLSFSVVISRYLFQLSLSCIFELFLSTFSFSCLYCLSFF
jgi:hypothetical protein